MRQPPKWFPQGLQARFLAFFIALDLTTLIVAGASVSADARRALESGIEEQLFSDAKGMGRTVSEEVDVKWKYMTDLAANPFVVNSIVDSLGRDEYLRPFMQKLTLPGRGGELAVISLLDFKGRLIACNQPDAAAEFEGDGWLERVLGRGQPHAGIIDRAGGPRVVFAMPVFIYAGPPEGAVVAEFDLSFAREIAGQHSELTSTLIDGTGRALLGAISPELSRRLREAPPGARPEVIQAENMLSIAVPVWPSTTPALFDWRIVASFSARRLRAPIREMQWRLAQIGALSALALALIVFWRGRAFVRPLQRMQATMAGVIENGDLSRRVPVDSADEIGALAETFNDMVRGLSDRTAELERSRDELSQLDKLKSAFFANVSHELRTPLTLIIGPLESLLARGALPAEARATLERMNRNADRLLHLVNELLDFAKLENGAAQPRWEAVDVALLVASIVEDARSAAAVLGIALQLEHDASIGEVQLDRRMFEKIVLNLLGNALKFTPAGGRIGVRLRRVGDALQLEVIDTGPGIAPDRRHVLFQRFQQIDGSSTRKHEGTGLGLALVKEFTTLMGGEVCLDSAPGKGSRFFVRLPLRRENAPERTGSEATAEKALRPRRSIPLVDRAVSAGASAAAPAGPSSGARVLVVEDNADMRAYIADVLTSEYQVVVTQDGREALAEARSFRPDLVVADVMMPEMDGMDLTRELKADPSLRAVPVILLSARAGSGAAVNGLEGGADDYLAKPFSPAELRARAAAALRAHRLYQELQAALRNLQETQEQLVQSGKMAAVGTLSAGLSHELNNPLGVILGFAQSLLKRTPPDTPQWKALSQIESHAARCSHLVRILLDFSRKKPAARERVSIGALLESITELCRAKARRHGVELRVGPVAQGLPEPAVCSAEIQSALLNLVTNAIDATPQGGSVQLGVDRLDRDGTEGVELSVKDTGGGIPPDVLPRIFDPFFTTKEVGKGTGLGLSLARQFVGWHGGDIAVETAVGSGTTMRVWLPVDERAIAAAAAARAGTEPQVALARAD